MSGINNAEQPLRYINLLSSIHIQKLRIVVVIFGKIHMRSIII